MKLIYQYMVIFFNFCTISNHLHSLQVENCDSNSRLVVNEDDNGEFRPERVKDHTCYQNPMYYPWGYKKNRICRPNMEYKICYDTMLYSSNRRLAYISEQLISAHWLTVLHCYWSLPYNLNRKRKKAKPQDITSIVPHRRLQRVYI